MLIDEVTIKVKAGNGGDGSISFKRNAQTPKGGPDGGNGGNGGNLFFQGIDDITGLRQFQFKKYIKADDGIPGKKNNLYGKNADHLVVKVPAGTQVVDLDTNETFEILSKDEKVLVALGGVGGKGNNSFKTATNQAPKIAEKGIQGQERNLKLVLRIIADAGLIGLPNAGKSSILKTLTNADPKIGNYPFTTTEPNLGVLEPMVIADIPGLIENASTGKGLGIKFLKHVEKTKFLVHAISFESDDLLKDYKTVNNEISSFNPDLVNRTKLVLLTKKDLFSQEERANKRQKISKLGIETAEFSIFDPNDIQYLKDKLLALYKDEK